MRMNEKAIVGETFDDLTNQEMAMLTGRGDVEPYSLGVISAVAVSLELSLSYSVVFRDNVPELVRKLQEVTAKRMGCGP